jgi:hypothetical protein
MTSVFDRLRAHWLPLLLVTVTPGFAQGADNGIYVGGAYAAASSDHDWSTAHGPQDEGNGFKAIVGARPFDWLAIEANYIDLGETAAPLLVACAAVVGVQCPDRETFDARALSVSAVGMLALPLVDLYARVGAARWETERQVRFGPAQPAEGTDPTYGVGVQGRLGSFALRFEYERFDFGNDDANALSLGFTYTFF